MKKTMIECRMFSRVNAKLLDYILSNVDPETMEKNLSNVEIDNEMMSDVEEVEGEGDDEVDTSNN